MDTNVFRQILCSRKCTICTCIISSRADFLFCPAAIVDFPSRLLLVPGSSFLLFDVSDFSFFVSRPLNALNFVVLKYICKIYSLHLLSFVFTSFCKFNFVYFYFLPIYLFHYYVTLNVTYVDVDGRAGFLNVSPKLSLIFSSSLSLFNSVYSTCCCTLPTAAAFSTCC